MENNLLKRLHTYASYQDENFTTESFVHLIEYLRRNEYKSLSMIVRKVTGGKIQLDDYIAEDISIVTQVTTAEGRPDIEISGPDFIIFIEVKVDSGEGDRQLERYRNAISSDKREKQLLILLSRFPHKVEEDILDFNIQWIEIGDWLREEIVRRNLGETSQYLIDQFTKFLQFRGLMFLPTRSRVSEFLKFYLEREKSNSIFHQGPVRSLDSLDQHIELMPLKQLLEKMEIALTNVFPDANIKVGSGITSRKGGGWIGLNINYMAFFFLLYLQDADTLIFETFNHEIDPNKFINLSGQIFESYGSKKWMNELDIATEEIDFFSKSSNEQLSKIEIFLEKCLDVVEQISI
jgi:hypothetical protein